MFSRKKGTIQVNKSYFKPGMIHFEVSDQQHRPKPRAQTEKSVRLSLDYLNLDFLWIFFSLYLSFSLLFQLFELLSNLY